VDRDFGHFTLNHCGAWSYFSLPELEERGIRHGFFTRNSPPAVLRDAEREAFHTLFSVCDSIIMFQEHEDMIHPVRDGERPTVGDGLLLTETGVAAIVKTADCLPVIIADPTYPMASIVHAGWRGTAKRITARAVAAMKKAGGEPARMVALLGPCISRCCYEVGGEVRDVFERAGFPGTVFSARNGSLYLDLREANRWMLEGSGISTIYDTGLCTYCNRELFASYRRGEGGSRQLNFVSLRR
jgi:Uncharacterized conserved protein